MLGIHGVVADVKDQCIIDHVSLPKEHEGRSHKTLAIGFLYCVLRVFKNNLLIGMATGSVIQSLADVVPNELLGMLKDVLKKNFSYKESYNHLPKNPGKNHTCMG